MNRIERAESMLQNAGYTVSYTSDDDELRVSVVAPADDDDSDLETIREIVGQCFLVEWCGEGNTDGRTGVTYEDISISFDGEVGEWATGPLNDNYGYDPDLVAPLDEVREAAELEGGEMWDALEACSWVDADSVSGPVYETYSDGNTLCIGGES